MEYILNLSITMVQSPNWDPREVCGRLVTIPCTNTTILQTTVTILNYYYQAVQR